jgi:alkanesulfonate monooxygenase
MALEFLWYLPNWVERGHRGDETVEGWGTLDFSTGLAQTIEAHGFAGALVGTGWGRPDTFTLSSCLAARTQQFKPLIATRAGYWHPALFASAAATLDQFSEGRVLVNVVTGRDEHRAYGDFEDDYAVRYQRTREFMHLVRLLWTREDVTFQGDFYQVEHATIAVRPHQEGGPPLYFGGASPAAERAAAAEADVQLLWGEPLAMVAERIERLNRLSADCDRAKPLGFGLRMTVVVRETTDQAWQAAEEKLHGWETTQLRIAERNISGRGSVGQARLHELREREEVLDRCLWTAPAKVGTGAGSTWLVGSPEDVIAALNDYVALGISHFILSDTPYREEAVRVGGLVVTPMLQREAALNLAGKI